MINSSLLTAVLNFMIYILHILGHFFVSLEEKGPPLKEIDNGWL